MAPAAALLALLAVVAAGTLGCRAAIPPPAAAVAAAAQHQHQQQRQEEDVEEIGSPLRVAQCRARCLRRFSGGAAKDAVCMQGPDCFMCWENCELLQSNYAVWGAMCTQRGICFPGCQQACKFHREMASVGQQMEPVIQTRVQEVLTVAPGVDGGGGGPSSPVVRWKRPPSLRTSNLVYVVMTKEEGSVVWRQDAQTVDLEARLLGTKAEGAPPHIRVLVVDPDGLVTIYSPVQAPQGSPTSATVSPAPDRPPPPPSAPNGKWIREDVTLPLDDAQHALLFPTASAGDTSVHQVIRADPWSLREVSLIHQKVLVIAEVAWDPRVYHGVYLVTWELDGGGLKGNLFTDSTCVTLSLWPDTTYHIQVELVSHAAALPGSAPDRSETMDLDTRKASAVSVEPSAAAPGLFTAPRRGMHPRPDAGRLLDVAAGSAAGVLLFAAVVAWRVAWRCRCAPLAQSCEARKGTAGQQGPSPGLLAGVAHRVPPTPPMAPPRLPIVSVRRLGDHLQHPDAYAAFLQQAGRGAQHEVQV